MIATANDIIKALNRGVEVKDSQGFSLTLIDGKIQYSTTDFPWDDTHIEEYHPYLFDGMGFDRWQKIAESDEMELKMREMPPESFIINCETKEEVRIIEGILVDLGMTGRIGKSPRALFIQYDGTYDGLKAKVRGNGIKSVDVGEWLPRAREVSARSWPSLGDKYYTVGKTLALDKFEVKTSVVTEASNKDSLRNSRIVFRAPESARSFCARLNSILYVPGKRHTPSTSQKIAGIAS